MRSIYFNIIILKYFFISLLASLSKKFEYLRENEFLRETILNCLPGAQMGWINEIKKAEKSRDTATFLHL